MKRTPADIPTTERREGDCTVITMHPGRLVFCDYCGEDFTDRCDPGGILFLSKAVCPHCAPAAEICIRRYHEEHMIRGRCPAGMAFADWVRSMR